MKKTTQKKTLSVKTSIKAGTGPKTKIARRFRNPTFGPSKAG